MRDSDYVWTQDNQGNPISTPLKDSIPDSLGNIVNDDPFRSVSEWVRDNYGFIKCIPGSKTGDFPQCQHAIAPPFLEFKWGDIFRTIASQNKAKAGLIAPPGVYNLTAADQVKPMWELVDFFGSQAQDKAHSGEPGFNQDPSSQAPKHPVSIDSHGCEQ